VWLLRRGVLHCDWLSGFKGCRLEQYDGFITPQSCENLDIATAANAELDRAAYDLALFDQMTEGVIVSVNH
jgi:hypothetical protein